MKKKKGIFQIALLVEKLRLSKVLLFWKMKCTSDKTKKKKKIKVDFKGNKVTVVCETVFSERC